MLRAAVEAARNVNPSPMVLGVTVLTSMDDQDLDKIGVRGRVQDQVLRLAALAITNGCQGVVASALEASELRAELDDHFLIVTPGVRPAGQDHGDQSRVVTPAEAIAAGATYIVVGRPITAAANPADEARSILEQMSLAISA
jgi:orotidine-5'-phosphate decarboxylase